MSTKTYFVSMKYSPGLFKEFRLLGQCLVSQGLPVTYLIDRKYDRLFQNREDRFSFQSSDGIGSILKLKDIKATLKNQWALEGPGTVFFYNQHPWNEVIVRTARRYNPACTVIVFLHEPYKTWRELTHYGLRGAIRITALHKMQRRLLAMADVVIVPSEVAKRKYYMAYRELSAEVKVIPLLLPRHLGDVSEKGRKWVSYIGHINRATGFDLFLDTVRESQAEGRNTKFVVISSSNLARYSETIQSLGSPNLEVINKKNISDSEIGTVLRKSIATVKLDTDLTQSGVVPVSYSYGTPVVARDIPALRQHVIEGETGYLVQRRATAKQLLKTLDRVETEISKLSAGALRVFDDVFSDANWANYYSWLVRDTEREATNSMMI